MKPRINVHIFESTLQNESRLLKETQMHLEWKIFDQIIVFGHWKVGFERIEMMGAKRKFIRLVTPIDRLKSGTWTMRTPLLRWAIALLSMLIFRAKIILRTLDYKPSFVSVHNPSLLGTAFFIKLLTGARIVYVPHELESRRTGTSHFQRISVWMKERLLKRLLHHTILVSPEIEKWYQKKLGFLKTSTIRNIPINPYLGKTVPESTYLKDQMRISHNDILFIYQGIINSYRGIETLLDVFMEQDRCHIVFMGFGELTSLVKECSERSEFVHFYPAVEMESIISVTSSADISLLFVDSPMSESYRLTTANKFYEGIISGTPFVISSNFSYMSEENTINNLGWVLPPEKAAMEGFVRSITREMISEKRKNCLSYGSKISWTTEAEMLKSIYR
jgi:hypothetical protein